MRRFHPFPALPHVRGPASEMFSIIGAYARGPALPYAAAVQKDRGVPACAGIRFRITSVRPCRVWFSHMHGNLPYRRCANPQRHGALSHAREPYPFLSTSRAQKAGSPTCPGTLPMRTRTAFPALKALPHVREPAVPRTPQPQSMLPSSGEARGESCGVSACPQDARSTSAIRATAFSVKRFRALARRAPSSRSASRPSE